MQAKKAADELLLRSHVGIVARVPAASVTVMLRAEILFHVGMCSRSKLMIVATLINGATLMVWMVLRVACVQP